MNIREFFTNINKEFDKGITALKVLLKEHNNFIATNDDDNDYIFGYDFIGEKIVELRIMGIRRDEDDDYIEVYCVPLRSEIGYDVKIDNWEEHTNDDWDTFFEGKSEGYWSPLFGGEMYGMFTLYNILEVIDEYTE